MQKEIATPSTAVATSVCSTKSPTRLALAVWHFPSKFERCCQSPAVGCLSTHWKPLFRHSREHLSETTRRCAPFVVYPLRRICRCWWSSARHRPCLEESRPAVDLGCFHAHSLHGRRSEERRVGKECRSLWATYH